jgi:Tfp pilus assembly protein PilW
MKTCFQPRLSSRRRCVAFTVAEMLIAIVTTVVVMGGAMATYIYGLKMMQFTQPKLTASDDARKVISLLTEDVRSAFDVKIGNASNNVFAQLPSTAKKEGNALLVYPSTDTNKFAIYYIDSSNKRLKRTTNNAASATLLAASISNQVVFTVEDYKGNVLSNSNPNKYVVGLTLQFYQLRYPAVSVGSNSFYDWYQLQSKVAKRTF